MTTHNCHTCQKLAFSMTGEQSELRKILTAERLTKSEVKRAAQRAKYQASKARLDENRAMLKAHLATVEMVAA